MYLMVLLSTWFLVILVIVKSNCIIRIWRRAKVLVCTRNISTTTLVMTTLFVPFCSAQDGESTDMNCMVFWELCKNGKILMKRQVYNKGIWLIFGILSWCEILISLECAVDCEWNDVNNFIVLCSVVEFFINKNHKNPAFNGLTFH